MEFNKAYSRDEFLSFLRVNFLPEDFRQETTAINKQFQYTQQVTRLGECESLGLVVYEVCHSSKHDARVGLTKEAFRLLADEFCERALVFFVPEDDNNNYRFSLIEITLEQPEDSARVQKKYSNPHRYSYYLGKGVACHTPNKYLKGERVKDIDDLRRRFSVEVLSDEFFEEFDKLYSNATYQNCEPGFIEEFEANPEMLEPFLDKNQEDVEKQKKPMRDYVKKLMGRLVFMQFLQKKGWLGIPADCEGWNNGNEHFLQEVFSMSEYKDTFLDDVLEPIFFEYLNTPYELRKKKYLSIGGIEYKVPYLNGGLFEQTELDRKPSRFSAGLFQRLFNLFDLYNFTVDENDPDDIQVSVDPEMLGRIFENQLEDNNGKGAFYTPKFIVQYMCRESLIAYLQTNIEDDFEQECIRYFVETHDRDILSPYQQKNILAKLKSVTICDPAIGSGAFPVGLLKELLYCRQELEPVASHADMKKQIIQENIYGVDLEQGAVDIARLRFWLSIMVDSERPEPLPNLDYKIVTGNSLLPTFNGQYIDVSSRAVFKGLYVIRASAIPIRQSKKALQAEQRRFYNLSGEEKYRSAIAIKKHILDIIWFQLDYERTSFLEGNRVQLDAFGLPIKTKAKAQVQTFAPERQAIFDKCEALQRELDDSSKSLKERSEIELPFFEWDIIFSDIFEQTEGEKGFDIVIGNPPYIQLQNNGGELARLYQDCDFKTFARTGDIYCLFYERGWQLLKNGGILCYITSNKWMRAGYGEKTREFFANKTNPMLLIDFAGVKIFESATVDTNILLFSKLNNQHKTVCAVTNKQNKNSVKNLSDFVQQQHTACDFSSSDAWVILSPIEQSIKRKIEALGTPLKDWDIQINYGIKTGFNDAFIISTEKRNEILANCKDADERERTAELIRPILRGRDIKRYGYVNNGLYLINTHNGIRGKLPRINVEDYPAIKTHLDRYWDKIEKRADKGDTPYNLRNCAYLEDFSRSRIVYREIGEAMDACMVPPNVMINNKLYMISGEYLEHLLRFFNSNLFNKVVFTKANLTGGKGIDFMESIRVPLPSECDLSMCNEQEVDDLLYSFYGLTRKEAELIENRGI